MPFLIGNFEQHRLAIFAEFNVRKWKMVGLELLAGGFGKRGGQLLVIKCKSTISLLGIHDNELLCAAFQIVAIPKPGVVVEPVRVDAGLVDAALRAAESATALLRGCVRLVCGGGLFLG